MGKFHANSAHKREHFSQNIAYEVVPAISPLVAIPRSARAVTAGESAASICIGAIRGARRGKAQIFAIRQRLYVRKQYRE